MKRLTCLVLLVMLTAISYGAVNITGETKVKRDTLVKLQATGDIAKAAFIWDFDKEDLVSSDVSSGRVVFTAPPGVYKVKLRVITIKDGIPVIEEARTVVTIGEETPVPPGPGPGPKPPDPKPEDLPIAGDGFKVMVIYETKTPEELTPGQSKAIFGRETRDYLKAKCAKNTSYPDGAFAFWDPNTVADASQKVWADVMKRPRTKLPWLVISNGKKGFEGPLPENYEEIMNLLKSFGG